MEYLDVKAYAKLIGKSKKTVYKMIKNGFLPASKEGKSYKVAVDTNMTARHEETKEKINSMKAELLALGKRVTALEKATTKTSHKL
jgi:excisionase family DNA binding protein